MSEQETRFDRFIARIKNNPILASLFVCGTLVVALSNFTDAIYNLMNLAYVESRPEINGEWQAQVIYDWPNANYAETFSFRGNGEHVFGSASYLGTKRGILSGKAVQNQIEFVTKTQEVLGDWDQPRESVHRYQGQIFDDEIRFVMQTEGGFSEHEPIEFTAYRGADAAVAP